ncbi:MAG: Crp/Fnr family transcriptional regulator [Candidatus Zixiibacteriota bacterium]
MLSTIERVLALEKNELFAEISTEGLAHLAAIAEEVEFHANESLFEEGAIPDACYLILAGGVDLTRSGRTELSVGPGEDLGVWALFDGEPRAFSAKATANTHALRIGQEEFYDLLSDHTDIVQSLFRTLVRRIRRVLSEQASPAGQA